LSELAVLVQRLKNAVSPEEVFGLPNVPPDELYRAVRSSFRSMARETHPDKHPAENVVAQTAFGLVRDWWKRAEISIHNGTYGSPEAPLPSRIVTVSSDTRTYKVGNAFTQGDISDLYFCSYRDKKDRHALLKIAQDHTYNDLLAKEAEVLKKLWEDPRGKGYRPYIPRLLDSFLLSEPDVRHKRRANIFWFKEDFVSMQDVTRAFPDGLDPRHLAWMWKRLLVVLGFAHHNNVVHGSVLPPHALVHPANHGLRLVDWTAATDATNGRSHLAYISTIYEPWYAPELLAKKPPTPASDIMMAARCIIQLAGGDPISGSMPSTVPRKIQGLLKVCLIAAPHRRPQDAWDLHDELDTVLLQMFGPPRFTPFSMPGS
jgi:hypothetical protein